jgi:predicted dehydrogenase
VHLEAYRQAGFKVAAIASRNIEKTKGIAARYGIPKVHDTPKDLISDPSIEIVDLAYPPNLQPALIRLALKQPHVKAILIQKPLALSLKEAIKLRDEVKASGKVVSINQNMRFDQSMRVLKQILDRDELGEVVFAQIDMHAIPHWQPFLEQYDRLTFNIMSIHHMDVMRHLFGEVKEITSVARTDPRTKFKHTDGIVASTLRFKSGVMAQSLEDVWSGPRAEGYDDDIFIGWRVEGLEGVAKGTIGWPKGKPSTLTYNSRLTSGGKWVTPKWETTWFPHAFIGVMEQLQYAVRTGTKPEITIADNVKSIALIEAGYKSMAERRTVKISEISTK